MGRFDEGRKKRMSNILTVYFSRKGENYWGGTLKNLSKGNTEIIAEMVHKAVGGDLFEVETVNGYSDDYQTCTEEAQKELDENARPELKKYMDSLDGYDTVFVGYPNWWGTMPMAMFAFLERYDLKGKRIIPFCTNEGSGMGSSVEDLKKFCNGAVVEEGLSIRGSESEKSGFQVSAWVRKMTN